MSLLVTDEDVGHPVLQVDGCCC